MTCGRCREEIAEYHLDKVTCPSCIEEIDHRIADLNSMNADLQARIERTTADRYRYEKIIQRLNSDNEFLKLDMDLMLELPKDDFRTSHSTLQGDVEIVVQGDKLQLVQAHRFILASRSVVFLKMFQSKMSENETGVVRIEDTTLPIMQAVIAFCYTAKIEFSEEVPPEEVLKVAHKYAIDHLRDVVAKELVTRINGGNLAEMLRLSVVCESKELQEAASQYLQDNFKNAFPSVVKALGA